MIMYVPGWCMHWGCTDGMLSQRKVWRLFFEGNVLFRSALKRMGAADWKVYQVGQASCNDL